MDGELFVNGARALLHRTVLAAPDAWRALVTVVPSNIRTEDYTWYSSGPLVQELTDENHQPKAGTKFNHTLTNKTWGNAIEILKDDLADDRTGLLMGRVQEMGVRLANEPMKQTITAISVGDANASFDGTNFYANTHTAMTLDNLRTSTAAAGDAIPTRAELEDALDENMLALMAATDEEGEPFHFTESGFMLQHTEKLSSVIQQVINAELRTNGETNRWRGFAVPLYVPATWTAESATETVLNLHKIDGPVKPMFFQDRSGVESGSNDIGMKRIAQFWGERRFNVGYGHPAYSTEHTFTT